jgi:hypothetical protein
MKFWQSFSKSAMKRQFLFGLFLFAVMLPIAILDSNTQVKVSFYDTDVYIKSDKYTMSIPYGIIESAELTAMAEPGERVENSYDNDVLRAGVWHNDAWGEYHIAADLDTSNCIVVHLDDGRTFVFSCKNDTKTEKIFNELQTHMN